MARNESINILLVEDEDFDVKRVKNTISYYESRIRVGKVVSNGLAALNELKNSPDTYDAIIMDYQISGGLMGEDLIKKLKETDPFIQIIVITKMTINITDYDFANNLLKAGAFWYCTKYPGNIEDYIYQPTDFILSIFNAAEKKKLEKHKLRSDKRLMQNIEGLLEAKQLIGESKPIVQLKENIEKYSKSDVSVLINGPSGTGKELVAWNIHLKSNRRYENFVPINCGSIPSDLIESELFGYEKGSFTGAAGSKQGLFEVAHNGTVFLDEVAELPPNAQVKLLRVIQEGEIEKIGRTKTIDVNVRILAATNKNLANEVNTNRFREDLYYRLNVVPIDIVPLRQRGNDILMLFDHFLQYFSLDLGVEAPELDEEAEEILLNYKWPGNVRELRNVVQRLVLNCTGIITAKDISNPMILRNHLILKDETNFEELNFGQVLPLRDIEKIFRTKYFKYVRSISSSDSSAADKLGLAPSNFYRMCKELGLK
ncbi:MAG: sigma-54 dependent transcriptional regulator [Melioribacteraceae bacterium]|nr:sigma-54 dependent transcriptional regulator [Melioribacteraceae bacterium]MCF8266145.1 sigma-54 dependent transcriptional regulator [Melioribacteraceae bacterium]MCF8413582.1 sigma-54 dependent transcriptional regulator [Melioribacteraceae bacterium]MCF8432374.1 sigma-54 dependent transcriptional regulator [Melioribacteraceae bacterium]